jgi:hypothetical protein
MGFEYGEKSPLSNEEYDRALESTGSSYRMPSVGGETNTVASYPQSVPVQSQQANAEQMPVGGSMHGLTNNGGGQVTARAQQPIEQPQKEEKKGGFNWMAIVSALI